MDLPADDIDGIYNAFNSSLLWVRFILLIQEGCLHSTEPFEQLWITNTSTDC